MIEVPSQKEVHGSLNIQHDDANSAFSGVELIDILIAVVEEAVDGHVLEGSHKGVRWDEVIVPRHNQRDLVNQDARYVGDCHQVDSDAITDDASSLRLLQEHADEESERNLSEGPSIQDEENQRLAGQPEELEVESELAIEEVHEQDDHEEEVLREECDYPVVTHLDPVDLHYINQFLFFLKHYIKEEYREAHAQGEWD